MRKCTVPGCSAAHYAKDLCRLHYRRRTEGKHGLTVPPCKMCGARIHTSRVEAEFCSNACRSKWHRRFGCYVDARALASRGTCKMESCARPVHANGLCRAHSKKLWKYGDPTVSKLRRVPPLCSKCGKPTKRGAAKGMCFNCYFTEYYRANVTVERARRNARRSRMVRATPPWADTTAIRKFYVACPPGHHVDHVIPLKGRRVSGLHVRDNLQYLPAHENRVKLNRFAA